MKNKHLAGSYVVLCKILCVRSQKPNLGRATFQVQSQVVLCKIQQAALLITPTLAQAILLDVLGMLLTILFAVAGMRLAPLLPAVADHLRVLGIRPEFLAVIIGPSPALALRPTANTLLRAINGKWE